MRIENDFFTSVTKALKEIDSNIFRRGGLIICGTHTPRHTEELIDLIAKARKEERPYLGICFGYQLAAIEYARNVLGIHDATSEEFSSEGTFVVKKRPEMKVGLHDGETWWSDYYVDIDFEVPDNWVVTPYHPEYQSSKRNPHPDLVRFVNIIKSSPKKWSGKRG